MVITAIQYISGAVAGFSVGGEGKLPGALRYPPTQSRRLVGFDPLFFQKGPNFPKKREKNKKEKTFGQPKRARSRPERAHPRPEGAHPRPGKAHPRPERVRLRWPISGLERTIQS